LHGGILLFNTAHVGEARTFPKPAGELRQFLFAAHGIDLDAPIVQVAGITGDGELVGGPLDEPAPIADAFGRAAVAFDAVGRQALPDTVRQLVATRLSAWRGEDVGLSRGWVDNAIETLPVADRPVGRLALLTALASYQVDDQVLEDARMDPGRAGDAKLIAAASWASFAAARRIGSWLDIAPRKATDDREPPPIPRAG